MVGTHSTEENVSMKRRKGQNGQSVPVKKAAAKKAAAKKPAPRKTSARVRKAPVVKAPVKKTVAKPKKAAVKAPVPMDTEPELPKEPSMPTPTPFLKSRTAAVHSLPQRATANGTVFVFGNGDCGQLGLGEDMLERKKPFPVPAIKDQAIVDVVSGGLHTMALDADGHLWSWGCNDQKTLGRDGDEFAAARVQGLDNTRIVRVACSDSATFALAEDGHVYAWGTFRSAEGIMGFSESVLVQGRPEVINAFREPIVDLCAGVDHALALSVSGKVYAWGYGQQGQLGRLVMER
ncbi:hypothetical protein GGF45_003659, partial [Coemansia sp. RSA 551]